VNAEATGAAALMQCESTRNRRVPFTATLGRNSFMPGLQIIQFASVCFFTSWTSKARVPIPSDR
jgi:hypothetical protein